MTENGMLKHFELKHWPLDECKVRKLEEQNQEKTLTLQDVIGAFIVLAAGLSIATVTVIAECFLIYLLKRRTIMNNI